MSQARGKVLLAEDDERERRAVGRALRGAAFSVEDVPDSAHAIAALEQQSFDVLLADINMPGVSGMELLAFVRDRALRIAVVLMTGLPTVDTAIGALRDGAVDYITKPLKPELLFERLDAAIKKQRLRSALHQAQAHAELFARSVQDLNTAIALAGPLAKASSSASATKTPVLAAVSASEARGLPEAALSALSPREREITRLIARGNAVGDVAAQLKLSPNTVRNHVKSIFSKLRVHSQLELVSKLTGLSDS